MWTNEQWPNFTSVVCRLTGKVDTHMPESDPECMIAKHLRFVVMLAVSLTYG